MLSLLRLVRVSLAPSLLADVAAGAALAGGTTAATLSAAFLCSLLLFVGGMALNARVDVEEDARTRPDRPLPSGALSRGTATALAIGGLLGAPLLGALCFEHRIAAGLWLGGMAIAIAAYHTPLRRLAIVGPALLGTIRGADLAWGAVAVAGASVPLGAVLGPALLYALYVFGASLVAHQEDREASDSHVRGGLCLWVLTVLALLVERLAQAGAEEFRPYGVGCLVGLLLLRPLLSRFRDPEPFAHRPGGIGALAGLLLGRMAWFTTMVAFAAASWPLGLTALGGLVAVRLLVRWIPPT